MSEARALAASGGGGGLSRAGGQPMGVGGGNAGKPNVVNPQLDQTRRIGAPGGGMGGGFSSSPSGNRGQYRPLTVKRPATAMSAGGAAGQTTKDGNGNGDGDGAAIAAAGSTTASTTTGSGGAAATAGGRVPLTDMSANASNAATAAEKAGTGAGGPETKRQRVA